MGNRTYHILKGMLDRASKPRREQRKVENNTYVYRYFARWPHRAEPVETLALVLHKTAIVYACHDAFAAFDHEFSGSKTTKDRMRGAQGNQWSTCFEEGKVRVCGELVAELPHERDRHSWQRTADSRAWLCTDLRRTYVVEAAKWDVNEKLVRVWKPNGDGTGAWYGVRKDNEHGRGAIQAMADAIEAQYGGLAVIAEIRRDVGDTTPICSQIAEAAHAFVTGFAIGQSPRERARLIDTCCKTIVRRRRRGEGLKGKTATTVLALATTQVMLGRVPGGPGEWTAHVHAVGAYLGATKFVNEITGEVVPMRLDDPSACKYWLHPDALSTFYEAWATERGSDEQTIRSAGEAGDRVEQRGASDRVQEVAGCPC